MTSENPNLPPRPLEWPQGFTLSAASRLERALCYIPILGWLAAWAIETDRFRPTIKYIDQQLNSRPAPPIDQWGSDPRRRKLATSVCQILQETMGWPNDHFIPQDPLEILMWAHYDGLDDIEAVIQLEHLIDQTILEGKREELSNSGGSLESLVDLLILKQSRVGLNG